MFLGSLVRRRLMAIETRKAAARMSAQFKFVHHGVLQLGMAFRTFSRGACERRTLSAGVGQWSPAIDEKCADNQRESDHQRDEHGTKCHHLSSQVSTPYRYAIVPEVLKTGLSNHQFRLKHDLLETSAWRLDPLQQ